MAVGLLLCACADPLADAEQDEGGLESTGEASAGDSSEPEEVVVGPEDQPEIEHAVTETDELGTLLPAASVDPRRAWVEEQRDRSLGDELVLQLVSIRQRDVDYLIRGRVMAGAALARGEEREFSIHRGISCNVPVDRLTTGTLVHVRIAPQALESLATRTQADDGPIVLSTASAGGALPAVLDVRLDGSHFNVIYPWGEQTLTWQ